MRRGNALKPRGQRVPLEYWKSLVNCSDMPEEGVMRRKRLKNQRITERVSYGFCRNDFCTTKPIEISGKDFHDFLFHFSIRRFFQDVLSVISSRCTVSAWSEARYSWRWAPGRAVCRRTGFVFWRRFSKTYRTDTSRRSRSVRTRHKCPPENRKKHHNFNKHFAKVNFISNILLRTTKRKIIIVVFIASRRNAYRNKLVKCATQAAGDCFSALLFVCENCCFHFIRSYMVGYLYIQTLHDKPIIDYRWVRRQDYSNTALGVNQGEFHSSQTDCDVMWCSVVPSPR